MRRLILITVSIPLLLLACYEAPLGSPEASRIDPRLEGVWVCQDMPGGDWEAYLVAPFDEHAWCVLFEKFDARTGAIKGDDDPVFRAWTTQIAGAQFITLEPVAQLVQAYADKRVYLLARLDLAEDGGLRVQALNPEFEDLARVKDPAELLRRVEANIHDPSLFLEAQVFRRADPTDAIQKKILEHHLGTGQG